MTTRGWVLFAVMSVVWGIPYLFIKVALEGGVPPAVVAWSRVVIASVLLLPIAWRSGALRGFRARWAALLAFGLFEVVLPFPLIPGAEQYLSSSLAAILVSTVPLIVALLAIRVDAEERASGWRLAGLVTGLLGVVVLLGVDIHGRPEELLGAAMMLGAAFCYAVGPMIAKRRLSDMPAVGPVAVSFALAAVLLAPVAWLTRPSAPPTSEAIVSVIVLGVVCSAIGLVLFFSLIKEAGPGRATVVTYINPLVAVALGVVLLDEHVGPSALVGLVLILGGSWIATRASAPVPLVTE